MGHEAKNGQLTCNIFWGDIKKNQVICPGMVIEAKRLGISATVEKNHPESWQTISPADGEFRQMQNF